MKKQLIKLHDLSTGYWFKNGKKNIIHSNINLSFDSGELICLIGKNGSGKSTLLRTISGFQQPLTGYIEIENKPIKLYKEKELAKIFSVVFTEKIVVDHMTVFDLISTGRIPYTDYFGKLTQNDFDIIKKAMEDTSITDLAYKEISTLSDGERQKTMIAKSIAQETPVIILDEPTAFLDFPSKIELNKLLKKLCTDLNKTIILSTHDIEQSLMFVDKICIVRQEGIKCYNNNDLNLNNELSSLFIDSEITFDHINRKFKIN